MHEKKKSLKTMNPFQVWSHTEKKRDPKKERSHRRRNTREKMAQNPADKKKTNIQEPARIE